MFFLKLSNGLFGLVGKKSKTSLPRSHALTDSCLYSVEAPCAFATETEREIERALVFLLEKRKVQIILFTSFRF